MNAEDLKARRAVSVQAVLDWLPDFLEECKDPELRSALQHVVAMADIFAMRSAAPNYEYATMTEKKVENDFGDDWLPLYREYHAVDPETYTGDEPIYRRIPATPWEEVA